MSLNQCVRHRPNNNAIYGFVIYVVCFPLFATYLIWAYIPHEWLHELGLTYLPNRHWAVTIPFAAVFIFLIGNFVYIWNNCLLVQSITSIYQIRDVHSSLVSDWDCPTESNDLSVTCDSSSLINDNLIPPTFDLDHKWISKEFYFNPL